MDINIKDIGIFIKFVEKQYISPTLDGRLFFSASTYFKSKEAYYKDKTMGDVYDPYESTDRYVMRADEIFIKAYGDKKIHKIPVKKIPISFRTVKPYGICSFMYLNFLDFEEDKDINTDKQKYAQKLINYSDKIKFYKLKSKVIEQLRSFQKIEEKNKKQKCVPLIFANNEFVNMMNNPKNQMGHGLVEYHDLNKEVEMNEIPDYSKKEDVEVLFKKDISYVGQREFRLIRRIHEGIKGEEFSVPELKGHISKSSIEDISMLRLILGYH